MIEEIFQWVVTFVKEFGLIGIFIMTFLESTFVPIPSEVTMIPAGYLVHRGEMNLLLLILFSISGTLAGSYFNYWLAQHYGRKFLLHYGHYLFLPPEKLDKMESYFRDHGPISIFSGRLLHGVRHYISLPAGLAQMNLKKFFIYTGLGGGIWMLTLIAVGYFISANQELLSKYMIWIKVGIALIGITLIGGYIWKHRRDARRALEKANAALENEKSAPPPSSPNDKENTGT